VKKSWILVAWIVTTIIVVLLVFRPIEKPKKIEAAKQPIQTIAQTNESSDLWIPRTIVFLNRPLFLEGELKERLIQELKIEVKRYKSGGLDLVKNDIWLSYIGNQIKKTDIPLDFIYLPIIESSMNPCIESSMGARGYWQFMPTTALHYKLKIEKPYLDERCDPIKSTDAAIRHLNDLVKSFDDWTASLGGYNMDPAALKEAIKQENTNNFYNLKTIPKETQRFPFRLMATKLIFENPEKYGFSKRDWVSETYYEKWEILKISLKIDAESMTIDEIVQGLKELYPDWDSPKFTSDFEKYNPHILDNLPRGRYKAYLVKRNGTS